MTQYGSDGGGGPVLSPKAVRAKLSAISWLANTPGVPPAQGRTAIGQQRRKAKAKPKVGVDPLGGPRDAPARQQASPAVVCARPRRRALLALSIAMLLLGVLLGGPSWGRGNSGARVVLEGDVPAPMATEYDEPAMSGDEVFAEATQTVQSFFEAGGYGSAEFMSARGATLAIRAFWPELRLREARAEMGRMDGNKDGRLSRDEVLADVISGMSDDLEMPPGNFG